MLFQFSTTGSMEREQSCESFDLLLQTLHQVLLHGQTPLSLELGIHNGEVIQAFRTNDEHSRRAIKNALRNVYPTSRLSTLPDDSFRPVKATSVYFADVSLENDLYSINRWQQLLTQSDPLSILLGSLVVNQHARFLGHVSITLFPLSPKHGKVQHKAFEGLQSPTMQDHKFVAKLFESSARSHIALLRSPAWLMNRLFFKESSDDKTMNLGSARHHERETDVQSASNKLSGSCFQTRIRIRVFGPANETPLATSLVYQIFAPLAQFNAPRLGQFKLSAVRTKETKKRPTFLLSCHEVSSIFHPPAHKTESLATSRFIQLEPPRELPLKSANKSLMNLGQTCFHSTKNIFGLLGKDAALHGFVVGSSGSGKTTLLTTAIMSYIKRGQVAPALPR